MGKISKNTSVSLLMSNNKTSNSLKKKKREQKDEIFILKNLEWFHQRKKFMN